jgi:hypothetical protein
MVDSGESKTIIGVLPDERCLGLVGTNTTETKTVTETETETDTMNVRPRPRPSYILTILPIV